MSERIQRQHTVLPRAHLRGYFGGRPFHTYDLQNRKWESWGPNSLGRIKEYHEHEIEDELQKVDSNAILAVRKLAQRCILSDEDRLHVAWYIAASLFRNPTLFDELLPEMLDNVKQTLHSEEVADGLDTTQHEADTYVDQTVTDEEFQRGMHGAWLDNAPEYRLIAENIYGLRWDILYVARKPNCLLLTDRPFIVHAPTHSTEAKFTFPISSEVMLRIYYDPSKRWHIEQMERKGVIQYGRKLVARAQKFVAAPSQDPNLTSMIERVRASKTTRTT